MKTFLLGLLTAAVIALIVGVGLQFADMSAASTYSTKHVDLSARSSVAAPPLA